MVKGRAIFRFARRTGIDGRLIKPPRLPGALSPMPTSTVMKLPKRVVKTEKRWAVATQHTRKCDRGHFASAVSFQLPTLTHCLLCARSTATVCMVWVFFAHSLSLILIRAGAGCYAMLALRRERRELHVQRESISTPSSRHLCPRGFGRAS